MVTYTCERCNKTFKQKCHYNNHLKRKNPCNRIFKCERCGKQFKTKQHFIKHQNRKKPCIDVEEQTRIQLLVLELENKKLELEKKEQAMEMKHQKLIIEQI